MYVHRYGLYLFQKVESTTGNTMRIQIKRLKQLNSNHKQAMRALEDECKAFDGINMSAELTTDMNFDKNVRSFFLLYRGSELAAFISLFIPSECEAEATAYVKPAYRKLHYFSRLVTEVCDELKKHGINKLLLVSAPCASAKCTAEHMPVSLQHSEYVMKYNKASGSTDITCQTDINLFPVTATDADELVPITMTYFDYSEESERHFFDNIMSDSEISMYKALLNDKIVGSVCVRYSGDTAFIFGLGIASGLRGKGYGKALLALTMNRIEEKSAQTIVLEVGSENKAAFSMYQKYGFAVISQIDYFTYLSI